ncbi:MAG: hypothetical protein QOG20_680 [Pseudonocardiales bacterium]|nr:hypothetical protein [Pseudonocardiales bacterium]
MIVRRERPHPGAQLDACEEADGWRYTAFATSTAVGQLAHLDARHRAHVRVEDRIRTAKDTGLDRFPSRSFAVNQAWLTVVMLAVDLIPALRRWRGRTLPGVDRHTSDRVDRRTAPRTYHESPQRALGLRCAASSGRPVVRLLRTVAVGGDPERHTGEAGGSSFAWPCSADRRVDRRKHARAAVLLRVERPERMGSGEEEVLRRSR